MLFILLWFRVNNEVGGMRVIYGVIFEGGRYGVEVLEERW